MAEFRVAVAGLHRADAGTSEVWRIDVVQQESRLWTATSTGLPRT